MPECTPTLNVEFCGVSMPNPFLLASAPPTAFGDGIMRAFEAGWGGAVLKTLKPDGLLIEDVTPRFGTIKDKKGGVIGFENFELVTKRDLSAWLPEIRTIKEKYPDRALIGSIMGSSKTEWQTLTTQVQEAGVDGLELNFSCPHGMPEHGMGAAIGQVPELITEITRWVKEVATVPVWVKLTPNVTSPETCARAAMDGGADAIVGINTVQSLIGVDLDTFEPLPSVNGQTTYGGYSGKAVKPIGLRFVAQMGKMGVPHICGVGGISSWKDAVEYMLLGAGCVQVCTEVMLKGYDIIREYEKNFLAYLADKGMRSPMDLVGRSLPRIAAHHELSRKAPVTASCATEQCVGCGQCITACHDAGYTAIHLTLEKKAEVDSEQCDGCSLCTHVCPTGALHMAGAA